MAPLEACLEPGGHVLAGGISQRSQVLLGVHQQPVKLLVDGLLRPGEDQGQGSGETELHTYMRWMSSMAPSTDRDLGRLLAFGLDTRWGSGRAVSKGGGL